MKYMAHPAGARHIWLNARAPTVAHLMHYLAGDPGDARRQAVVAIAFGAILLHELVHAKGHTLGEDEFEPHAGDPTDPLSASCNRAIMAHTAFAWAMSRKYAQLLRQPDCVDWSRSGYAFSHGVVWPVFYYPDASTDCGLNPLYHKYGDPWWWTFWQCGLETYEWPCKPTGG